MSLSSRDRQVMGDDLKSLLLFKVSICFGPDEVLAICRVDAYLFMLTLSFNPITEERLHLFLGSSYVNGPVNCSIGHRVGGHRRAREHKNTRFVMTIFTTNRTKRQVLQNGRTIHQTQF